MATVIGIDEAGLGPVLGPLVVSAAAFEVPDEAHDASLWQLLSGTVSRRLSRKPGTVAIADSKILYSGSDRGRGFYNLERGVLTALATSGHDAATLAGLLARVAPDVVEQTRAYHWYRDLSVDIPRVVPPPDLADAARRLEQRMTAARIRLLWIRSTVVLAGEFNHEIRVLGNKAAVNFAAATPLLHAIRRKLAGRHLVIHVDRQGGRRYYLELLRSLWPEAFVWIRDERPHSSKYVIEARDGTLEIAFTVGCEQRQLPVALASMTSKYLRELLMERFNAFWTAAVPGLAPTAGYFKDGQRFWREIQPELARLRIDPDLVYRCR